MIFLIPLLLTLFSTVAVWASPADTMQLQQLINKSQQQIDSLKEIIEYKKADSRSLDQAVEVLNRLTAGIDNSIAKYQGTKAYEKALTDIQAKNDFVRTYEDSQKVRQQTDKSQPRNPHDKSFDGLIDFQKQSVKANQDDIEHQRDLQGALTNAPAGFVGKIQAQAELGSWQANTRISAQMTELLSALSAVREELRVLRMREDRPNILSSLIEGSEIQSQKLNKDITHATQ